MVGRSLADSRPFIMQACKFAGMIEGNCITIVNISVCINVSIIEDIICNIAIFFRQTAYILQLYIVIYLFILAFLSFVKKILVKYARTESA